MRLIHWIEWSGEKSVVRIRSVEPLQGFLVRLEFSEGSQKIVDLEPYLHGPVFEMIKNDPGQFRRVAVDPELGTVVWPNGADIDPDVLYQGLIPAWQEAG
jgi:hypothetical protein